MIANLLSFLCLLLVVAHAQIQNPNYLPPGVRPCFTVGLPSNNLYPPYETPQSAARYVTPYNTLFNLSINGTQASSFYNSLTSELNFGVSGIYRRRFVIETIDSFNSSSLSNVTLLLLPALDEDLLIPCTGTCSSNSLSGRDLTQIDSILAAVGSGMSLWVVSNGTGPLNNALGLPTPLLDIFGNQNFSLSNSAASGPFNNLTVNFETNPSTWNSTTLGTSFHPLSSATYNLTSLYSFFYNSSGRTFMVVDGDIRHYTEIFPPPPNQFTPVSSGAKLNVLSNILQNFCPTISASSTDATGLGTCQSNSYHLSATGCSGAWVAPQGVTIANLTAQSTVATILVPGTFKIYWYNCMFERAFTTLLLKSPVAKTGNPLCLTANANVSFSFSLSSLLTLNCAANVKNFQVSNLPANFTVINNGNSSTSINGTSLTVANVTSSALSDIVISLPSTIQGFSFPPQQVTFDVIFTLTSGGNLSFLAQGISLCSPGYVAQAFNSACFCFRG